MSTKKKAPAAKKAASRKRKPVAKQTAAIPSEQAKLSPFKKPYGNLRLDELDYIVKELSQVDENFNTRVAEVKDSIKMTNTHEGEKQRAAFKPFLEFEDQLFARNVMLLDTLQTTKSLAGRLIGNEIITEEICDVLKAGDEYRARFETKERAIGTVAEIIGQHIKVYDDLNRVLNKLVHAIDELV